MGIPVITYSTLIEAVKNYIKTNCKNWTDDSSYSQLSIYFKSGYTGSVVRYTDNIVGDSPTVNRTATYQYYLSGNAVPSTSYSQLTTDMNTFCTSIGLSNTSINIPASEFYNFINDLVSFCSSKVRFAKSHFVTNPVLIYYPSATTYKDTVSITSGTSYRLTYATDANTLINNILATMTQNIRTMNCVYSITLARSTV